jgi:hypothetical protein
MYKLPCLQGHWWHARWVGICQYSSRTCLGRFNHLRLDFEFKRSGPDLGHTADPGTTYRGGNRGNSRDGTSSVAPTLSLHELDAKFRKTPGRGCATGSQGVRHGKHTVWSLVWWEDPCFPGRWRRDVCVVGLGGMIYIEQGFLFLAICIHAIRFQK